MALPLRLLWGLRISIRQKIGLGAIFSFVVIIIVVSIVRVIETINSVIETHSSLEQSDPVWLSFWSILESSIAVWVSCFPTFRILFKTTKGSARDGSPHKGLSPNDSEAERHFCDPQIARKQSRPDLIFPVSRADSTNPLSFPSKATTSTLTTLRRAATWDNSTTASSNASDITRVPSVARYTCALDDISIPSPTLSKLGEQHGTEARWPGGPDELYYDHKEGGDFESIDNEDDDGRAEEDTYNDYIRRVHRPRSSYVSNSRPRDGGAGAGPHSPAGEPSLVWHQRWSK
jgi:hypothetical protein